MQRQKISKLLLTLKTVIKLLFNIEILKVKYILKSTNSYKNQILKILTLAQQFMERFFSTKVSKLNPFHF